jgi:MHS family alpha-ketoglutarate permease-like MFS transporter
MSVTPQSSAPSTTSTPLSATEYRKRIFAILGASSGNLVEWFDFYVYSFCAIYFAPAFFPKVTPPASC